MPLHENHIPNTNCTQLNNLPHSSQHFPDSLLWVLNCGSFAGVEVGVESLTAIRFDECRVGISVIQSQAILEPSILPGKVGKTGVC